MTLRKLVQEEANRQSLLEAIIPQEQFNQFWEQIKNIKISIPDMERFSSSIRKILDQYSQIANSVWKDLEHPLEFYFDIEGFGGSDNINALTMEVAGAKMFRNENKEFACEIDTIITIPNGKNGANEILFHVMGANAFIFHYPNAAKDIENSWNSSKFQEALYDALQHEFVHMGQFIRSKEPWKNIQKRKSHKDYMKNGQLDMQALTHSKDYYNDPYEVEAYAMNAAKILSRLNVPKSKINDLNFVKSTIEKGGKHFNKIIWDFYENTGTKMAKKFWRDLYLYFDNFEQEKES